MRAAIVDYGVGNIRSVSRALASSEAVTGKELDVIVSRDPEIVTNADLIVLPGVGSFTAATQQLESWSETLRESIVAGTPTLAMCLGLQLLFEKSEEGTGEGIGAFSGAVTRLTAAHVPQMGWNTISPTANKRDILQWAYFAHSFACRPDDKSIIAGTTDYEGDAFASIIRTDSVLATQFHPEKSDVVGITLIHNFIKEVLT